MFYHCGLRTTEKRDGIIHQKNDTSPKINEQSLNMVNNILHVLFNYLMDQLHLQYWNDKTLIPEKR